MSEFLFEHLLKPPPDNISALLTPEISNGVRQLIESLSDEEHYNRFFAVRYGGRTADCFHCQDFMAKTLQVRHLLVMAYERESRELGGFKDVYFTDEKTAVMAGIVGKKYRGQGLGTRLNTECFEVLREVPGLEVVEMDILYCNEKALRLGEKLASRYPTTKRHSYGVTNYKFSITQQAL